MWKQAIAASVVLALASPAAGAARKADDTQKRILVLPLKAPTLKKSTVEALSDVFAASVRRAAPHMAVFGVTDVALMLELEKQQQLLGCDEYSCITELGGAIGANYVALGGITEVEGGHLLSLRLVDRRQTNTVQHISELVTDDDYLLEAVTQWGAHIMDPAKPAGVACLRFRGKSWVAVDGTTMGRAPLDCVRVRPGQRQVAWKGEDGEPNRTKVVRVEAYETLDVEPPGSGAVASGGARRSLSEVIGRPPKGLGASFGFEMVAAAGNGELSIYPRLEVSYTFRDDLDLAFGFAMPDALDVLARWTLWRGAVAVGPQAGVILLLPEDVRQSDPDGRISTTTSVGPYLGVLGGAAATLARDVGSVTLGGRLELGVAYIFGADRPVIPASLSFLVLF